MKFDASPELSDEAVEAIAVAFAKAFMSLPRRARVRCSEIIEGRNGWSNEPKRDRAARLESFKESQRTKQKANTENQQATEEASPVEQPHKTNRQLYQEARKKAQKERKASEASSKRANQLADNKKEETKRQQSVSQKEILRGSGITAAEASLIKFRQLNPDPIAKNGQEPVKPYKPSSKLISSGTRFCELCGKYHQGNTCY